MKVEYIKRKKDKHLFINAYILQVEKNVMKGSQQLDSCSCQRQERLQLHSRLAYTNCP